jgi:hypothetical protein
MLLPARCKGVALLKTAFEPSLREPTDPEPEALDAKQRGACSP